MRRRVTALGAWALLTTSGCALMWSANVAHNSRGMACVSTPIPSLIDLAIAGASLAAVVNADDDTSRGWYAVPISFGAMGLIGIGYAAKCSAEENDEPASRTVIVPANNTAPAFGEAPIDPEAREPSFEERTASPPPPTPPPSPLFDRNGIPIGVPVLANPPPTGPAQSPVTAPQTGATSPAAHAPTAPSSTTTAPRCTTTPRVECPDGYYCQLVEENTGTCVKLN